MSSPGSSTLIQSAFEFIERSNAIGSLKELTAEFGNRIAAHGYTSFGCAGINGPGGIVKPENFFGRPHRQWEARYFKRAYYRHDAVVRVSRISAMPFTWRQLRSDPSLRPEEARLFDEASEYGILEGFITPISNFDGSFSIITMGGAQVSDDPRSSAALHMMSLYFGGAGRRLAQTQTAQPPASLTGRQREIVTLLCAGYRQSDVAYRLGVSERTVETHLAHARIRLNTSSTPQLGVEAMRLGLVNL